MTVKYNDQGVLTIGNVSLQTIAASFGTPTIVYDEEQIRTQCRRFHEAFKENGLSYNISYASKAFSSIQLFKLMEEEEMGLDVVSEGELYTALASGFDPSKIHFHGNNKTNEEIEYAIESGVEYFVIDSLDEITRINRLASKPIKAVLRVNPGVEAHTHEFIQTGQEDSKFGLSIKHGTALEGVSALQESDKIDFKGIHFHIGSQIFEADGTINTIQIVFEWLKEHDIEIDILNLGGGFSIKYTEVDKSYPIEDGIKLITDAIKENSQKYDMAIPEISIEPGRSIVGEAGVTLYQVGTIKEIPNVNTYVSIDGGMSDHIRTALYDAQYKALLVNRNDQDTHEVTIAGKLCESGDLIGRDMKLPKSTKIGDYIAVLSTGAYHYSMSSNYNQMLKPSVLFVKDGKAREVIKRQTLKQLIMNDVK
ncbi:diaminopimelate decarboxylase [Mammaliicoccus sciuri]|uniref:diaminopimelate decarboxylase n=1 Tax=Mammaliicoccus sciuri TaxID=1296 RepID=UPI001FB4C067|nr:diaminopimelate decarboxylase [Mammaliicoccus sciuri]MCJ0916733.1 diaminopimelate decarboxylase [Mammaliicoccus sciuri]MCJ0936245.1 diaminopimelate decarboxylase [Mammaliicoccus sciuri]